MTMIMMMMTMMMITSAHRHRTIERQGDTSAQSSDKTTKRRQPASQPQPAGGWTDLHIIVEDIRVKVDINRQEIRLELEASPHRAVARSRSKDCLR